MMRFREWDYRTGVVAEYRREGECLKCGECCRANIEFTTSGRPYKNNMRNGGKNTDEKGIWQEIVNGRWKYYYQLLVVTPQKCECHALSERNLCQIQNKKAGICKFWPFSPICIVQFPDCGYSFNKIGEWVIQELE